MSIDYSTDHAAFRRDYSIVKKWLAKRGKFKLNAKGERHISDEDWRAALEAHDAETLPHAPPPQREPAPAVRLVEPGSDDLRVAILCPGPSLKETWPEGGELDGYDLVFAVNNAGEWAPCDWWCCNDPKPLTDYECRPRIGILTGGSVADTLNGDRSFLPKGWTDADLDAAVVMSSVKIGHNRAPRKAGWSTLNAIIFAARIGGREIDLYGDDKRGTVYHDGRENKGSKVARWDRERRNQAELLSALESAGVTVRNVQPTEADS